MNKTHIALATFFVLTSCTTGPKVTPEKELASGEATAPYYETEFVGGWDNKSRNVASGDHISGYKIGKEFCGQGEVKLPRVPISTRSGYCVGIVAGQEQGLIAPRTIVPITGSKDFLLADFGGWVRNNGRIILIKREGGGYVLKLF